MGFGSVFCVVVLLCFASGLVVFFKATYNTNLDATRFASARGNTNIKILDKNGELFDTYELFENEPYIKLEDIPTFVKDGFAFSCR